MYTITAALIGLCYFGFVSVLLNLYLIRLGYDTSFIGLVNGSTALAFAATSVPSGAMGSRWGYRNSAILGVCLLIAGVGLIPLAEFLPAGWQRPAIIVTRLLNGAGFALYLVNANPYLVEATSSKERDLVFALQVGLPPATGFFGNLIAGSLPGIFADLLQLTPDHPAPYRYPLYIAAVLLMPAVIALLTTQKINSPVRALTAGHQYPVDRGSSSPIPYLLIGGLAVTALLRMGGEGAARSFFNVYLDTELSISTARIGLLFAIGQIIAGPTALFAPYLIQRRGKLPTIVGATLGIAGSLMFMALVPHWAGVGAGFTGVIGMLSITRAVTNVYQMEIVAPEWRGLMSGVVSMAMGIGFSSMALLGGIYVIPNIGYSGLFLLGAGMVTSSALLFWFFFRVPRGEFAKQSALVR